MVDFVSAQHSDSQFTTYISYLEIYNENGYDLLDPKHEAAKLDDLPWVIVVVVGVVVVVAVAAAAAAVVADRWTGPLPRSTQPCIPPGLLNWVPALAMVKVGSHSCRVAGNTVWSMACDFL